VVDIFDIFTGRSSEIAPAMNAFRDALLDKKQYVLLDVLL